MITFKYISLMIILVSVIEFAIFINMSVPYYSNTSLVFVGRIVIGNIQLGITADYAILMTSHYHKEKLQGVGKSEALAQGMARGMIKAYMDTGMSVRDIAEKLSMPENEVEEIIRMLEET